MSSYLPSKCKTQCFSLYTITLEPRFIIYKFVNPTWCWFHCVFIKSRVNAAVLPGDFRALYASICWQALWRCWFPFLTLNPIWNLWIFSRERWETVDPTIQTSWSSIVPQQSHRLIASMPFLTDAGICAKGAPTKYWVHNEHNLKNLNFSVGKSFFDWS